MGNFIMLRRFEKKKAKIGQPLKKRWVFKFFLHTIIVMLYVYITNENFADLTILMIYSCAEEFFFLLFCKNKLFF